MRLTQGLFAFLPDLTDDEILAQIEYALTQGWSVAVEVTDDPHPRNTYWEMWGTPMFDLRDAAGVMLELEACRRHHAGKYVRVLAFDSRKGYETVRLSFIVDRPADEPGFELVRAEGPGRRVHYTIAGYAARRPPEGRYGAAPRAE